MAVDSARLISTSLSYTLSKAPRTRELRRTVSPSMWRILAPRTLAFSKSSFPSFKIAEEKSCRSLRKFSMLVVVHFWISVRKEKFPCGNVLTELDWRVRKCGCSSVVEHHVANVRVVSSNLITRYKIRTIMTETPHKQEERKPLSVQEFS